VQGYDVTYMSDYIAISDLIKLMVSDPVNVDAVKAAKCVVENYNMLDPGYEITLSSFWGDIYSETLMKLAGNRRKKLQLKALKKRVDYHMRTIVTDDVWIDELLEGVFSKVIDNFAAIKGFDALRRADFMEEHADLQDNFVEEARGFIDGLLYKVQNKPSRTSEFDDTKEY